MDKPSLYTPNELSAFQLFTDFLTNLNDHLSTNNISVPKSLTLYHRLISSVKFNQEAVFNRHISSLRTFCIANRDSFITNTFATRLEFSDRIFIDFQGLLSLLDEDTTTTVWDYLYNLSRLLDSDSRVTSEAIAQREAVVTNPVVDDQFNSLVGGGGALSGVTELLGGNMGGSTNPMAMLGTMMNPETMNDIMDTFNNEIKSGNINLDELTSQMGVMMKQFEPIMTKLQTKLNLPDMKFPEPEMD